MNSRQVTILAGVAVVLGIAVTALKFGGKSSSDAPTARTAGQTLFESFPATDVHRLEITGAEHAVTLNRKDGRWTIVQRDDYPADTPRVNEFLRTLSELKVTQNIEAGPSFAPRFGMDETASSAESRGLTVAFHNTADAEIARVSFGKNLEGASSSPFGGPSGRYVRNHADSSGFYAVGEVFPTLSDDPKRWLDSSFIALEKITAIRVSQPGSEDVAWQLRRADETAEFTLEGIEEGKIVDTAATSPLKSLFAYARFDDVVPKADLAERGQDEARRTITIETLEGFQYTLTLTPAKAAEAPPAEDGETPPAPEEKFLLTIAVQAEIPAERKKEDGESEEDAKSKDEAFAERSKTLREKLEKEQAFAGRTFEVSRYMIESLLKERDALTTTPPPPAPPAETENPAGEAAEGDANAALTPEAPRTVVTTPPIEAVTPPIAIPPLEEDEAADETKEEPAETPTEE